MKQNALILFGLGIVVIGSVLLTTANAQQDPCFPAFIAVPGGQSRAALEGSDFPGTWTFTIESVKGNISSNPDPFGRPQVACGATVPVGHNIQAGAVSIKRVKVGSSGSLTLDEGVYCVRPLAFGKGEVTISVHPH
jgi:hypothetical protein